jgi:WD40 repeat protein
VFVALDQELHREVALKEIRDEYAADPESQQRFVREAGITGGLEHPGVVPVYSLGRHADGRPYYAMRFIQGDTLQDALRQFHAGEGAWTLRGLLARFVAVCNAMAYAHSRGVIHRDLKPANVMLGKYGETLVVDWGLAKVIGRVAAGPAIAGDGETTLPARPSGETEETQLGSVIGTPAYMSPEQACGQVDQLGPAADIYSLGATLYALLTGRPPIEGKDSVEVLLKARRGDWLPPRRVKPDMPAALDAICRKALAAHPEQRYTTALELAADVERWLADEPVTAYPEPWTVRSRRWMRRHRTLVSTAVGALVVALLGTAVGLVLVSEARDNEAAARKIAENKEQEWREQKDEADRRREEARFNQYVAQMNLVQREYEAKNFLHVGELLDQQVPQTEATRDLRGFEWYYWHRLTQQELLTLKRHTTGAGWVAFSPDGKRLASADFQTITVWDGGTGRELLTIKGAAGPVVFSPDGTRLAGQTEHWASIKPGELKVWDARTGQELLIIKGATCPAAFSPDGTRLAGSAWDFAGNMPTGIKVWDARTGQELLALKGHPNGIRGLAFNSDGKRIASADYKTIRVRDAGTGQGLLAFGGHSSDIGKLAFSPDGKRLATVSTDETVKLWDSSTGQELLSLKTGPVDDVAFSPDGKRLASASHDDTVKLWDSGTGQELLSLKGHRGPVLGVAFSPDGQRLASASSDGTVKLWDNSISQDLLTLKGHTRQVQDVAFSPDGRHLATVSSAGPFGKGLPFVNRDSAVRLWESTTGRELLALKEDTRGVRGSEA